MRYKVSGTWASPDRELVMFINARSADAALLEGLRRGLTVRAVSADRSPRAAWARRRSVKPGGGRRP